MQHDEQLEKVMETSENWAGAACIALFLIFVAVNFTGCTNVEWSLKIKDLGQTTEYKENLTTQKGGK